MSLRDELVTGEVSAEDVQKAYDEAGRYEFMGRRLEPWTIRRHSVALQLRSRLMRGIDDENNSIANFLADGFYPHVVHDLVVVLYLLHLDSKQVVELEQLSVVQAMDRAYGWAEKIPLVYGSDAFFAGAKILAKLLYSISVSWFQVAPKETPTNGEKKIPTDGTGPLGNWKSVSEPCAPADSMPNT